MNTHHTKPLPWLFSVALLLLAASASAGPLQVGDPAPDVTLVLHDGAELKVGIPRANALLVYFYPADETPGCTAEAVGFRDIGPELEKVGIQVVGVSLQDADSHRAFIENHGLTFPLAVDDGTVAAAFGVPVTNGRTARQSFLIRRDATIAHIWRKVDPLTHAAEVLAAAQSLSPSP